MQPRYYIISAQVVYVNKARELFSEHRQLHALPSAVSVALTVIIILERAFLLLRSCLMDLRYRKLESKLTGTTAACLAG